MDFNLSAPFNGGGETIAVVAICVAIGWVLFGLDNRIEERRRRAIDVGGKMRALGFVKIPAIFESYGVGDYSGVLRGIHELHDVLADPGSRQAELEGVFRRLLEAKLRDPEQRQALLKLVGDLHTMTAAGEDPAKIAQTGAANALGSMRTSGLGREILEGPPVIQMPTEVLRDLIGLPPKSSPAKNTAAP